MFFFCKNFTKHIKYGIVRRVNLKGGIFMINKERTREKIVSVRASGEFICNFEGKIEELADFLLENAIHLCDNKGKVCEKIGVCEHKKAYDTKDTTNPIKTAIKFKDGTLTIIECKAYNFVEREKLSLQEMSKRLRRLANIGEFLIDLDDKSGGPIFAKKRR